MKGLVEVLPTLAYNGETKRRRKPSTPKPRKEPKITDEKAIQVWEDINLRGLSIRKTVKIRKISNSTFYQLLELGNTLKAEEKANERLAQDGIED